MAYGMSWRPQRFPTDMAIDRVGINRETLFKRLKITADSSSNAGKIGRQRLQEFLNCRTARFLKSLQEKPLAGLLVVAGHEPYTIR
jgi:hypothetical protein